MNCILTDALFRDATFNNGNQAAFFFDDLTRWAPKFHFTATTTQSTSLWAASGDNVFSVGVDTDTSNTNVGIGTANPLIKLHVVGTMPHGINYTRTDARDARISVADPTQQWSLASGWATAGDFSIIQENVAGNRLYIKQNGNVGINTSTPSTLFHVEGGTKITGMLDIGGGSGSAYLRADLGTAGRFNIMGAPNFSEAAYIDLNGRTSANFGRVGLMAATDTNDLTATHIFGKVSSGNVAKGLMTLRSNGTLLVENTDNVTKCYIATGTGATACTSDRRLKKDIHPIENALDRLLPIQGVYYKWKGTSTAPDKETRHLGVIAQEVQKVFPEAVIEDEKNYLAVSVDALVPVLIEAVKTLHEQNTGLSAKLDALQTRVTILEKGGSTSKTGEQTYDYKFLMLSLLTAAGFLLLYKQRR